MAQIKISELNSATNLNNNDVFPIVNGGDTKKATLSQLKSFVGDLGDYYTKNEVDGITGDLDELETTENSNLVGAINEINNKAQTIQYSTMPTASSETVGKIVQFTGTTDSTYTNGYFYIGVTDGESTPTYSWEQVNTQPGSSSGGPTRHYSMVLDKGSNGVADYTFNATDLTNISNLITQIYASGLGNVEIDLYANNSSGVTPTNSGNDLPKRVHYQFDEVIGIDTKDTTIGAKSQLKLSRSGQARYYQVFYLRIQGTWSGDTFTASSGGTSWFNITSEFAFANNVLAKTNTDAYNPTANSYNPATTKYVDTAISNKIWIGTQTQYDNLGSYSDSTLYFIKEDTNVSA